MTAVQEYLPLESPGSFRMKYMNTSGTSEKLTDPRDEERKVPNGNSNGIPPRATFAAVTEKLLEQTFEGPVEDLDYSTIWELLASYYAAEGMLYSQVEHANAAYLAVIDTISSLPPLVVLDKKECKQVYTFGAAYIDPPQTFDTNEKMRPLYPQECRNRGMSYSGEIRVDITRTQFSDAASGEKVLENTIHHRVKIGEFPIMVRSNRCHLLFKSTEELYALDECPEDQGGYFICKGKEKVLIAQERLAANTVFVFRPQDAPERKKYLYQAEIRSVADRGTRSTILRVLIAHDRRTLMVFLPGLISEIPVGVLFALLGATTDEEIMALIYPEAEPGDASLISKIVYHLIYTSRVLRKDPEAYVAARFTNIHKNEHAKALKSLVKGLLPHLSLLTAKKFFLGYVVRKLINVVVDIERAKLPLEERGDTPLALEDCRDHFMNKRVDSAGKLLEDLFREVLERYLNQVHKYLTTHPGNIHEFTNNTSITSGLSNGIATGNWSSNKTGYIRKGVSQMLNRMTYTAMLSHLTKISANMTKDAKNTDMRQLHQSYYSLLCPVESSEGGPAGLVKNLSIGTHITLDTPAVTVKNVLDDYGVLLEVTLENLVRDDGKRKLPNTRVLVNGDWYGMCAHPRELVNLIKELRANRSIDRETSVSHNVVDEVINIYTSGGRLTHPVFVVREGKVCDYSRLAAELKSGAPSSPSTSLWQSFIDRGDICFIDSAEIEVSLVASSPEEIIFPNTDYAEIHPSWILGACANCSPYPDHNPAPRNTYQVSMIKQSLGVYATNFLQRYDICGYVLMYPQKPLVTTQFAKFMRLDTLPAGQNVVCAVAAYGGYNQEDSQIYNIYAAQRGMFTVLYYKTYMAEEKNIGNQIVEVIELPPTTNMISSRNYAKLGPDGIIKAREDLRSVPHSHFEYLFPKDRERGETRFRGATPVRRGDVVIGKVLKKDGVVEDRSEYSKTDEVGYVDSILVTTNASGHKLVKVRVVYTRHLQAGDKVASRSAQKNTEGIGYRQEDMLFNPNTGMSPDIIINPLSFPSRMTISQIVETVTGKSSALSGTEVDSTPFTKYSREPYILGLAKGLSGRVPEPDKDEIPIGKYPREIFMSKLAEKMKEQNFSFSGKEVLYSGFTGEPCEAYIFVGPVYYQRLKHMILDKLSARSTGQVDLYSRQPMNAGRKNGLEMTAIRAGHMEIDALKAHGAAAVIRERTLLSSCKFKANVCSQCGKIACFDCANKGLGELRSVDMPYTFKLLCDELIAMGINPQLTLSKDS